jgi:hypothetical protein
MKKILLISSLFIICYGDYTAFDIKKGWNSIGSSFGIKNILIADKSCISYYSIFKNKELYTSKIDNKQTLSIQPNNSVLVYSQNGGCTIHLPTIINKDYRIQETWSLKKGLNFKSSSYKIKNILSLDSECISSVSILKNNRFQSYEIEKKEDNKTDENQQDKDKKLKNINNRSLDRSLNNLTISANSGVLYKAVKNCDINITTSDIGKIFTNTPLLYNQKEGIYNPKRDYLTDFKDARNYFKHNCMMCHTLYDKRLLKDDLNLENKLLPYKYSNKNKPPMMVKYISNLSDRDIMVLAKYTEVLYAYTNKYK